MLKARLKTLPNIKETPHRTALAFAIGLFVGISPLLGIHAVVGLVLAWLLKLNRVVTFTGLCITNPWSIVPIYTFCIWIGAVILGVDIVPSGIDWRHVKIVSLIPEIKHIVLPFVVGTTVVGAASALLGYIIVRKSIEKTRSAEATGADKPLHLMDSEKEV